MAPNAGGLDFVEKDIFAPGRVQIIGLSADTVEKQKRFVDEQKLTVGILLGLITWSISKMTCSIQS